MEKSGIPEKYQKSVREEKQGKVIEVSYKVRNYINSSRSLVLKDQISALVPEREVVSGDPIIKKCNVYLPVGYDYSNPDIRYNVLYLLHGVGGDQYEWLSANKSQEDGLIICNILDNLIEHGDIEPIIVVFPNGRSAHDFCDCSFDPDGTNILGFYYFDYELRYDLIPMIEETFHTYADIRDKSSEGITYNRLHRAIAGLSMGGMQALNLIVGGHRCDSIKYTRRDSGFRNGLNWTSTTPGMLDLFAHVGAFSNAPTSSNGQILGNSIASSGYKIQTLYINCGDEDAIAFEAGFTTSMKGLCRTADEQLVSFHQEIIPAGKHNFEVWNYGALRFLLLCYGDENDSKTVVGAQD
ncbi:MAG: esterase [Herbinix sp.]|jgi:S-formylglutathione hydrolase FrmB|nr:esterase [Herbinix sp.]